MPIAFDYDRSRNILFLTVRGKLTPQEFLEAGKKIVGSEDIPPQVNTLWDLRSGDFSHVDSDLLDLFIDIPGEFPERSGLRVAVVAEDDFHYGLARMYELRSGNLYRNIMVFRDMETAVSWLIQTAGDTGDKLETAK